MDTYYSTKNGKFNPKNWKAHPPVKTNVGTSPKGSEWAKINLPANKLGSEHWAFKDLVEVPKNINLG